MNIITEDLPLNHHFIGINSTIPFFLIVNNDENTKTYHSPNDYQINVWDMMLKEKFPNSPAWTMQIRYDKDSILDSTTLVISSYDVDLANNTAGAKQITVIDGGCINSIQSVNTINTLNILDSVNEIKKVLEVVKVNSLGFIGTEIEQDMTPKIFHQSGFKYKDKFRDIFSFKGKLTIKSTINNDKYILFAFTDINNYSTKKTLFKNNQSTYELFGDFCFLNDISGFKSQLQNEYNIIFPNGGGWIKFFDKNTNIGYFFSLNEGGQDIEFTGYQY